MLTTLSQVCCRDDEQAIPMPCLSTASAAALRTDGWHDRPI